MIYHFKQNKLSDNRNTTVVGRKSLPVEKSMLRCPRCGNIGNEGAIYCEKCGTRIQMDTGHIIDTETTQELPKIQL